MRKGKEMDDPCLVGRRREKWVKMEGDIISPAHRFLSAQIGQKRTNRKGQKSVAFSVFILSIQITILPLLGSYFSCLHIFLQNALYLYLDSFK